MSAASAVPVSRSLPVRAPRLRVFRQRSATPWPGRLLRLALFAIVIALLHGRGPRELADGTPVTAGEVRALWPEAQRLEDDPGPRGGQHVIDDNGIAVGYVLHTLPAARSVVGYAGPTDTLVAFDGRGRIAGLRVRSSADTANHVADVRSDREFMAMFDGLTWDEAAAHAGIDAVSGASLTSRAIVDGVTQRLRFRVADAPWHWGARDVVAVVVLTGGVLLAFRGRRVRRALRIAFALATVVALGFIGGDFVSQNLIVAWAQGGPPLRAAPGLVLLCAAACVLPWATGKAVYCQQVCPHGLLQDFVARLSPFRLRVPADARRALRWLPRAIVLIVGAWTVIGAPVDLAQIEAFDAYLLTAGAGLSIVWAVASVAAAVVVPRAYCRFACPTGALLEGLRSRRLRRPGEIPPTARHARPA